MATVREILKREDFANLDQETKAAVFQKVAPKDQEWQALDTDTKLVIMKRFGLVPAAEKPQEPEPQKGGFAEGVKYIGRRALQGLATLGDLPGQVVNYAINPMPPGHEPLFPQIPNVASDALESVWPMPEKPDNTALRYGGAIAESAGGALPFILAGPGGWISSGAKAAQTAGNIIGSGAGAQLAEDVFGDSPTMKLLLSLAGGVTGGKAPQAARHPVKTTKELIPTRWNEQKADARAGELINQSASPRALESMDEGQAVVRDINMTTPDDAPKLQPTLGQVTGDPGIIAQEQSLRRGAGTPKADKAAATQQEFREREIQNQAALRASSESLTPDPQTLDDTMIAVQAQQEGVMAGHSARVANAEAKLQKAQQDMRQYTNDLRARQEGRVADAGTRLAEAEAAADAKISATRDLLQARIDEGIGAVDNALNEAGGTVGKADASRVMRKVISDFESHAKQATKEAYSEVGDAVGNTATLKQKALQIRNQMGKSGELPEQFPKDVVDLILDKNQLSVNDSFVKVQQIRSQILEKARKAEAEGGPTRYVKRLYELADSARHNMRKIAQNSGDPQMWQRYQDADAVFTSAELKLRKGVMAKLLRPDKTGDLRVADEDVGATVFHTGKSTIQDMKSYIELVGDRPLAVQSLSDYIVGKFADDLGISSGGKVDAGKMTGWIRKHSDALSVVPELREKLSKVGSAQEAVDDLIKQRDTAEKLFPSQRKQELAAPQEELKSAEKLQSKGESVYGKLEEAGTKPSESALAQETKALQQSEKEFASSPGGTLLQSERPTALLRALGDKNPTAAMKTLIDQTGRTPEAIAGLRREMRDVILREAREAQGNVKVPSTTSVPGMAGTPYISPNNLNRVLEKYDGAIKELYPNFADRKILTDIRKGFEMVGQSNTTPSRMRESQTSMNQYTGALIDEMLGRVTMGQLSGPFAWKIPARIYQEIRNGVRRMGAEKVRESIVKAHLDPEVGRRLIIAARNPTKKTFENLLLATQNSIVQAESPE